MTPFPTRFELRHSLDEALRSYHRRSRQQMSLVDSGPAWTRFCVFTILASGLSFLGLWAGALPPSGLPLVAVLLGAAFIGGVYSAGLDSRTATKQIVRTLHEQSSDFGPWDVTVTERTLEASAEGRAFRLDLAAVRSVTLDDIFVVLTLDSGLDFAIPQRCFGQERAVEAFKGFVEARRARSAL